MSAWDHECVFGSKRGRMDNVGMRWELCTYMAQRMLIQCTGHTHFNNNIITGTCEPPGYNEKHSTSGVPVYVYMVELISLVGVYVSMTQNMLKYHLHGGG